MYKILIVTALLLGSAVVWATPSLTVKTTLHNAATDLVQVPITIVNDANVANVQFDLVYPAGAVQAVAAFPGEVLSNSTHLVDAQLISSSGGNVTFRVIVVAQTANLVDRRFGDGELLKIPFLVNQSQFTQNASVNIQNVIATNETGDSSNITVNAFGGLIVSPNDTGSDSDGDGIPDSVELAFGTDPSASEGVLIADGTPLNGQITQNSVLAQGGTYPVTGNLEIAAGAKLTIYQNTTLQFNSGTGLTVNGELQMLGEGNVLTSSRTSPYKGSWKGVTVMSSASNVAFNGATIEWATYGIYFNNASGEVHNTTLRNNSYGIYVYQTSHPIITDGNIIVDNNYGIYIYGVRQAGLDPNPVINRNRIYNNIYQNLSTYYFYDPSNVVLDATDNWWGSESIKDIVTTIYDNMDSVYYSPKVKFISFLDANSISSTGNAIGGEYGIPNMVSGQSYHALDNVTVLTGQTLNIPEGVTVLFYSNTYTLQIDGSLNVTGTEVAPVTFRSYKDSAGWNSWKGIEISSSATNISIDGAIVKDAGKGIYFNDTFNLNSSLIGHVINTRIENNYTGIYVNRNSSPLITNGNVITQNGYGVQVYGSYSTVNDPAPVITYNSIYDNSYNNYWAYYFANASNTELDATYNWWGTIDTATIDTKIYDNADFATYSPIVNYIPYLDAEGGNPIGLPDQPTAVISGPNSGLINNVLTFDGSGSTDPQGDPLSYVWDMGDGALLNGAMVNHIYSAAGTFAVSLTVSDGQFDHTATQTVTITDGTPPPAGILSVESIAGAGQPIHPSEWVNIYWTGEQPPANHNLIIVREATGGQATTGRSTDEMTYDAARNAWFMQSYIPSGVWLNEPYFFKILPTFPQFADPNFGEPESDRFVIVP